MSYAIGSACSVMQSKKLLGKNKGRVFSYEEKLAIIVDIALIAISAIVGLLIILSSKGISLGQMSGIGTLGIKSVYVLVAFAGFIIVADISKLIFKMIFQIKRLAKEYENLLVQTPHETVTNLSAESEGQKLQIEFLEEQNKRYLKAQEKAEETCQKLMSQIEELERKSQKAAIQAKSAAEEAGLITSQQAALSDRTLRGLQAELTEVKNENQRLKKTLEELRLKLASAQDNANRQLIAENKELREQLEEVERSSDLEQKVSKTKSDLEVAQLELEAIKIQIEEKLEAKSQMEREYLEKKKSLREQVTALKIEVNMVRNEWQHWQESASRFRNEANDLQQKVIELRIVASKQSSEIDEATLRLQEVEAKLEEVQNKLKRRNSTELKMELFKEEQELVESQLQAAKEEARQIQEDIVQLRAMAKAYLSRIDDLKFESKRKEDLANNKKMKLIEEAEKQIDLMIKSEIPDEAKQTVLLQARSEADAIIEAANREASKIRQEADDYYKDRERHLEAAQRKKEELQRAASPRPEQIAALKEVLDSLSSGSSIDGKEMTTRQRRLGREERLASPHSRSSSPSLSPSLLHLSTKIKESAKNLPELSHMLRLTIQTQVQSDKLYQPWLVIHDFQLYLHEKGIEISEEIKELIEQQKSDIQKAIGMNLETSFVIIRNSSEHYSDQYFKNLLDYIKKSEKGEESRIKRCFEAIYSCIMANISTLPEEGLSKQGVNIEKLEELADKMK